MEPEKGMKEELHEMLEMTRENNQILHIMRRNARIGTILKVLYLGFIVATFYGAYVFAEPYLKQLSEGLKAAQGVQSNVSANIPVLTGIDANLVQNLLKKLNGEQQ